MIIIQGSSRADGNTARVSAFLSEINAAGIIHLSELEIAEFSYDGPTKDDFEDIIEQIIKQDAFILATPVYWYTMSGRMKTFIDRISDLLKWNKDLGRKLRGKKMYVISCSGSNDVPSEFKYPFVMSADYLGMEFKSYLHTYFEEGEICEQSKRDLIDFTSTKID